MREYFITEILAKQEVKMYEYFIPENIDQKKSGIK